MSANSGYHNGSRRFSRKQSQQYANKFSAYGFIASVFSLFFLAVWCQLLDQIATFEENQLGSRLLVENNNTITQYHVSTSDDQYFDNEFYKDNKIIEVTDSTIDCGDIFLATRDILRNNNQSIKREVLLCHHARRCKSSGWPSRILLPLLLCHGVDDNSSLFNGTADSMTYYNDVTRSSNITASQSATTTTMSTILLILILFPPLLLYLLLLFRLLATTADNYFSPSLETFSFELGLPPRFAGATLLALGNGSPDLGSTVNAILLWNEKQIDNNHDDLVTVSTTAAMDVGGGDEVIMTAQGWIMSVGNLIGGGMFVGTIVCGLLVNECSGIQCRAAFLRDVSMYALSVGYVWHLLEAGRVTRLDAWILLGLYVLYVAIVFCADIFHKKVTVERINREAKERRQSIRAEKALRLSQLYDKMKVEMMEDSNNNLEENGVDELTPLAPYAITSLYYGNNEGEDVDDDHGGNEDTVPDIMPSFSITPMERRPRPRLSVSDRFALMMSNYDPGSVRNIGSSASTITDESREDSEVGTISTAIHDIKPPILRAVSPSFLDAHSTLDNSTHSPPNDFSLADDQLLDRLSTPLHSNCIPSPPPSVTSSIASKERVWSCDLFVDAYEELLFQAQHFWENTFQNKVSTIEKVASFLELPFSFARMLTIPLPVEDHYCRPIVALSTALSPFWLLYYYEQDFSSVSGAVFISIAIIVATAILRYADEDKMPLVACIPLSLYGFIIAATWIDFIGGALVDLLQFFGTFLQIPPGILGMTVLAVGNSMGDLSSNLAMARNGVSRLVSFLSICYFSLRSILRSPLNLFCM
jgi:Ca2+/Na+ antiporter